MAKRIPEVGEAVVVDREGWGMCTVVRVGTVSQIAEVTIDEEGGDPSQQTYEVALSELILEEDFPADDDPFWDPCGSPSP